MYAGSDAGHQPALHHHAAELDLVPCRAFEAKVAHEQRVLATALLSPEEQRGYGVLSSAHHGQVRRASQPTTIRAVSLQGYKDLRTRELLRPPYHVQAGLHSSAQYGHRYTHAQRAGTQTRKQHGQCVRSAFEDDRHLDSSLLIVDLTVHSTGVKGHGTQLQWLVQGSCTEDAV